MIKFRIVSARVFAVGSRSKSYVLLEQQQQAHCELWSEARGCSVLSVQYPCIRPRTSVQQI